MSKKINSWTSKYENKKKRERSLSTPTPDSRTSSSEFVLYAGSKDIIDEESPATTFLRPSKIEQVKTFALRQLGPLFIFMIMAYCLYSRCIVFWGEAQQECRCPELDICLENRDNLMGQVGGLQQTQVFHYMQNQHLINTICDLESLYNAMINRVFLTNTPDFNSSFCLQRLP